MRELIAEACSSIAASAVLAGRRVPGCWARSVPAKAAASSRLDRTRLGMAGLTNLEACTVAVVDRDGRVLLVKPSYKDGWEIPGGYVEQGESPMAAAHREVREELGADFQVTDLLVLDWAPHPAEGDKLLVIFRGPTLDSSDVEQLQLDRSEITEARFFDVDWEPVTSTDKPQLLALLKDLRAARPGMILTFPAG